MHFGEAKHNVDHKRVAQETKHADQGVKHLEREKLTFQKILESKDLSNSINDVGFRTASNAK